MVKAERKTPITTQGRKLSAQAAEELTTQALRIRPWVSADRLWTRLLTDKDRQQLGGDLEKCYSELGTAGMWMKLHDVSAERAVIEVARKLEFLNEQAANWLLREIGEEPALPADSQHPVWHKEDGKLRLCGEVVRRVRVMKRPSSIQRVLDAFQAAGWPSRIDDPVTGGQHEHSVRQIVFALNKGLKAIRFHVQEAGKAITWSRA